MFHRLQFCSEPTSEHEQLDRQVSNYDELEELKQSLLIKKHAYQQQYASIYYIRLLKLRKAVFQSAKQRWGSLPGLLQD
jgi:DNA polymerase delta subunit 2